MKPSELAQSEAQNLQEDTIERGQKSKNHISYSYKKTVSTKLSSPVCYAEIEGIQPAYKLDVK